MVNWTNILNVNRDALVNFANGNTSGRQLETAVRFTDAAGDVRTLLRRHGVNKGRQLSRAALRRRNVAV